MPGLTPVEPGPRYARLVGPISPCASLPVATPIEQSWPSFGRPPVSRVESSKQRYRAFVKAYKDHTLEDPALTEHKPLTDPKESRCSCGSSSTACC